MAWTAPNTGFTPASKVTDTLNNEISNNLLYLKERADVVDADIDQGVKTTDSPTFVDASVNGYSINSEFNEINNKTPQSYRTTDNVIFNNLTINGDITPRSNPTESTLTLTATGDVLVPRGFYSDIYLSISVSGAGIVSYIERFISGAWRTVLRLSGDVGDTRGIAGASLASSGSDLRIRVATGATGFTVTAVLRKS